MKLQNTKIVHNSLGVGTVSAFDGKHITVEFATKTSQFIYPDAFQPFLTAEDPAIQAAILQEIEAAEKAKKAEAEKREEKVRRLVEQYEIEKQKVSVANPAPMKQIVQLNRTEGQSRTFFVFQGSTFFQESYGGYMWAPIENEKGLRSHYWERLLEVRKGDIILHGCDGYIRALSIAVDCCHDCKQPEELVPARQWAINGRRINCDYTIFSRPIKTANYRQEILKYCNVKYAPFNKDGSGNQGYLFDINRDLARFFIEKISRFNPKILEIPEVHRLMNEGSEE